MTTQQPASSTVDSSIVSTTGVHRWACEVPSESENVPTGGMWKKLGDVLWKEVINGMVLATCKWLLSWFVTCHFRQFWNIQG